MLSRALPHQWVDEEEVVLHLFEECNSADIVECIGMIQGNQYPIWMVTQEVSNSMHYVLSTSWHAHSKLHRGECAMELLLEVAHDGRADELVVDSPYSNRPLMPPSFLTMWNQPSTKEVWSEVL